MVWSKFHANGIRARILHARTRVPQNINWSLCVCQRQLLDSLAICGWHVSGQSRHQEDCELEESPKAGQWHICNPQYFNIFQVLKIFNNSIGVSEIWNYIRNDQFSTLLKLFTYVPSKCRYMTLLDHEKPPFRSSGNVTYYWVVCFTKTRINAWNI